MLNLFQHPCHDVRCHIGKTQTGNAPEAWTLKQVQGDAAKNVVDLDLSPSSPYFPANRRAIRALFQAKRLHSTLIRALARGPPNSIHGRAQCI